jgi:hypothetical protein
LYRAGQRREGINRCGKFVFACLEISAMVGEEEEEEEEEEKRV